LCIWVREAHYIYVYYYILRRQPHVLFCFMLISNLFITTVYRISRNDRKFLPTDILILTASENDKWNSILFFVSLSHILSIYPSIHPCMHFSLSLYLLLALSDTRLESEVRNDRCSRPAVYTERDETLMQRGSLVRARNFGFPVYRRRLAAHIRCVCRRYELRGSARRRFSSS